MTRATPQVTDPSDPPELDMDRATELAPEYGLEFLMPDSPGIAGGSEHD